MGAAYKMTARAKDNAPPNIEQLDETERGVYDWMVGLPEELAGHEDARWWIDNRGQNLDRELERKINELVK